MTAERLAKIRAIADDSRADPFTRSIAQRMLEGAPPQPGPINPQHPGMRTTAQYEKWARAMRGKKR
jgi:hypothetical protein